MKTIAELKLTREQYKEIYDKYEFLKQKSLEWLQEMEFLFIQDKLNKIQDIFKNYEIGVYQRNWYQLKNYSNFTNCIDAYIEYFETSEELKQELEELKALEENYDEDTSEDEIFETKCNEFFVKFWKEEFLSIVKYLENVSDDEIFNYFYENEIIDGYYYQDGILLQEAHS